jgi:hypothetical protein
VKVPPKSPLIKVLNALIALEAVSEEPAEQLAALRLVALQSRVRLLEGHRRPMALS